MELSTHLIVEGRNCPQHILDRLEIMNPEFLEAERSGRSTKNIPETIKLYFEYEGKIYLPRNIKYGFGANDKRIDGKKVNFKSKITLKENQIPVVNALVRTEDGIIIAPCGTGKTVMGIDAMCRVGVTTLVLVHKVFLLNQWRDNIKKFTGEDIGIVRGDTWHWKDRKVVVATLQTLYSQRDRIPKDFLNHFGLIISDECHRVSAPTWSHVITMFPARRRWGLTATPERADGLEIIFHAHMGDIVARIEGTELTPQVYIVETGCFYKASDYYNRWNNRPNMPKLITLLTMDEKRNRRILRLLLDAASSGRKIIVLTDRVAHAEFLKKSFELNAAELDVETSLFVGGKHENLDVDVIFATSQKAKEGLDVPFLDTIFLTCPSSSRITVEQSIGRILREFPGKKNPLVVDFSDDVPVLESITRKRIGIYHELNYPIKVV